MVGTYLVSAWKTVDWSWRVDFASSALVMTRRDMLLLHQICAVVVGGRVDDGRTQQAQKVGEVIKSVSGRW